METADIMRYAPRFVFAAVGMGIVFLLQRYKNNNDAQAWLRNMYARTAKAEKNEEFRKSELADAEAEIAKYPVPDHIEPMTNKQQIRVASFPKFCFMTGLTGLVFLFFGLFDDNTSELAWPVYTGAAFLVMTLLMYVLAEKEKPYFNRVRQLNRKYLLQKAGKEPARIGTLKEVMQYYPKLPELWLELSDQYAVDGKMDDAVAAVRKAREIGPDKLDFAFVEASFELRRHDGAAAAKALDDAEKMKKVPSDPRVEIYRAALALQNNEKKKALRLGEKAMELDADFTPALVKRDEGLKDLAELLAPLFADNGEKTGETADSTAENSDVAAKHDFDAEADAVKDDKDIAQAMEKGEEEG